MQPIETDSVFQERIQNDGCFVLPGVLAPECIIRLKEDLCIAIDKEAQWHKTKDYSDYGMVLMCAQYSKAFVEIFDNPALMAPFNAVLGNGSIVYAYTSSSVPPNAENYSVRIHTDCPRLIPDYVTNMGATIALDDFTLENGATWYLPKSQTTFEQPSSEHFFAHAKRFVAPAGSVLFFNARLWHSGGKNSTSAWRHALTINMCRPYMKQRLDIPRMLSGKESIENASQNALQKLGFFAQIPASYEEYYVPPEKRKFKQKAE